MNNQSRKQKSNYLILIMFAIVIIVLGALLIMEIKVNFQKNNVEISAEKRMKEYIEDKAIPQGLYAFTQNYKGEIDRDTFYKKLHIISQYIIDLNSDLQEIDVNKYFDENEEEILEYLGINELNEFVEVANIIKSINLKNTEFKHCAIEKDSFKQENLYTCFNLVFHYQNNETVKLRMELLKKELGNKPILKVNIPE